MEVFLPLQGISIVDSVTDEGPADLLSGRKRIGALFDAIKRHIPPPTFPSTSWMSTSTPPAFAQATTDALLKMLR